MAGKLIDEEKNEFEERIDYKADDKPFADDEDSDKPVGSDGAHDVYLLMFV